MTRTIFQSPSRMVLAVLAIVLGCTLVGCGESDRDKAARAAHAMRQAMAVLDQAHQGFVAPAAAQNPDASRADWVQAQYLIAINQLKPVLTEGVRSQQHGAAQLLAQLHAARAGYLGRAAAGRWAAMSDQAATVMTHLAAVQRAAILADILTGDESQLQAELAGVRKQIDFQLQSLRQRSADLRKQIDTNQAEADRLMTQRDQLMAQAGELDEQAFTAADKQAYDLKLQAIELRRQADQWVGQLERLSVQRSGLDSESGIVNAQVQHLEALAVDLSGEIQRSAARDGTIAAARDQALQVKQQAVDGLVQAFTLVAQKFNDEVAGAFDQALDQAGAAVNTAQHAVRAAAMRGREDARLGLLAAQVAAADVRTRYVLALGGFGQTVAVVAGQAADAAGPQGRFFTENLHRLAQHQTELTDAATTDINAALELAADLGVDEADSEPARQAARLQAYLSQLNDARIAG